METMTVNKSVNISFRHVFESFMTPQSFITIKWQERGYQ